MFSWLLTKPAIVIDLVLGGIIVAFAMYFWYANGEVSKLTKEVTEKTVQLEQNDIIIKTLNERLILIQKLNDNFNKSINAIQQNEIESKSALEAYNLPQQAAKNPRQAELFINQRNQKLISKLNSLSSGIAEVAK